MHDCSYYYTGLQMVLALGISENIGEQTIKDHLISSIKHLLYSKSVWFVCIIPAHEALCDKKTACFILGQIEVR